MTKVFKLTRQEYINIGFLMLFRGAISKLLAIMFFGGILSYIFIPQSENGPNPFLYLAIFASLPLFNFYTFRKNYKEDKLSETIEYTFANDSYTLKWESFSVTINWNKILKVERKRNWIIIFQSKSLANAVPKKYSSSMELKKIIHGKGVKNNL